MDKLDKGTTHSVPRGISPKQGNSVYRKLQNLLESELPSGAISGVVCGVIALISDHELIEDKEEGSKYTYGDASVVSLSQPFFYTVKELHSGSFSTKSEFSKYIDHELIPTGFQIITESKYSDLCDIMIQALDENSN